MTRVLSAVVIVAIVFSTLWFAPSWVVLVLAIGLAAVCGIEFAQLARASGAIGVSAALMSSRMYMPLCSAAICLSVAVGQVSRTFEAAEFSLDMLMPLLLFLFAAATLLWARQGPGVFSPFMLVMGPYYLGMPLGMLARLQGRDGPIVVCWFLVVMAVSDTAQYYSGRMFGRRKLAPTISPAKTVEGAIGGLLAATVAGGAFAALALAINTSAVRWTLSVPIAASLALLLAGLGIIGDLFESKLKRSAGAKDTSTLIPGHGGVLDRLDSYLMAAPWYFVAVTLLHRLPDTR